MLGRLRQMLIKEFIQVFRDPRMRMVIFVIPCIQVLVIGYAVSTDVRHVPTAIYDLDTPVTKYTKSLHLMDKETCPDYTVRNCIHCGRCLQVCPVSIDPMRIVNSIQRDRLLPAVREAVRDCQNCGCCAIVCPSRIPLHHIIREAAVQLKGEAK